MSGGVPASKRARGTIRNAEPSRSARQQARDAAELFERFTGMDAEEIGVVEVPGLPKVVMVIGECDSVFYTTVREGRVERYRHDFRKADRPLLCCSPDGRQLLLVGGNYDFTELGIVDHSDPKHGRRARGEF